MRGLGFVALLSMGCAVGTVPGSPFGNTDPVPADDDDSDGSTSGTSLDSVSASAGTTSPTTTGVLPTDGPDTDSGRTTTTDPTIPEPTTTSGDGDTTTTGADASSSGSTIEYETCPSSNTLVECATAGGSSMPYVGDLMCSTDDTLMTPDTFDFFVLPDVIDGDCIWVQADNVGGDADLAAYVVDVNGAYFGLEPDFAELDDEVACTDPPFNGFACPSRGVAAITDGPLTIAVGQWGMSPTCTDGNPYTLWVAVGGTDVDLSAGPVLEDMLIDPLSCP